MRHELGSWLHLPGGQQVAVVEPYDELDEALRSIKQTGGITATTTDGRTIHRGLGEVRAVSRRTQEV